MLNGKASRRRAQGPVDVDCADCSASRRCWGEPLESASDVLVRRQASLDKGALLLRQGAPFGAVYLLASGCLCLRETMPEGAERIIGFRVVGELVGLEGWVRGRYTYTADAAETTRVCRLAWPCASGKPGGSNALLQRLLAKTAAQLDWAAQPWPGLPAIERVAAFVEDFARRVQAGSPALERVKLPMTRAQIGSYLGLAEETVVRALTQLRSGQRLDFEGRTVCLRPA